MQEMIEFAINIDCPIRCDKYCPQDVILQNYKGEMNLSFTNFQKLLVTVPKNVVVGFAGVAEPFLNKDFVGMLIESDKLGYKLSVFTTLVNATLEEFEWIKNIQFVDFCMHMPDPEHMNLPYSSERSFVEHEVWVNIKRARATSMNDWFVSNNRENLVRNKSSKRRGYCWKLETSNMIVYPNGNVQICCIDMSFQHTVGNLFTQSYCEIRENLFKNKPYELCSNCNQYVSPKRYFVKKVADKIRKAL
jgi:hypothetical protein